MMLLLLGLVWDPCNLVTDFACICIHRPDPHTVAEARRALAGTEMVFTGRVLHTRYRRDSTRVATHKGDSTWYRSSTLVATMAREMVWKGQVPDTVDVETIAGTAACGASLDDGEHYLIDGASVSESVVTTSKCGWTRPLSQATRLQALLRRAAR